MEPIAIIGLAFKLPSGVEDVSSFWDMLENGRNMMKEWPADRANFENFYNKKGSGVRNRLYSKGGYFMDGDPAIFDAPFFSLTSQEAAAMDPQQRWLLEMSYKAFENAGIPIEKAAGTNTAVYASSTAEDYMMMVSKDPDLAPQTASTSVTPSIQANRLSWYFDLRGPSIHVNTACSSSMITMDLACQSLRNRQSSMALVTSCNAMLAPEWSIYQSNMSFLSPDSKCYSFDHRANGYARGEGVAVLVLKRLSDAIRDRDPIRAVIRGTGSNQDGHTPGMANPSQAAQEALIRQVYKDCDLGYGETRYVEAHGTGTQIGDVTEANALGRIFKASRSSDKPLYIGSIKASIGHLEGGSGLASILKSIMILESGIIPPSALFEKLNPKIRAKAYHLKVPTTCIPWPTQGLRRISVDSFGFGGANSHIVLDDAAHTIEALGFSEFHRNFTSVDFSRLVSDSPTIESNGVNGVNGTNGVNGIITNGKTVEPRYKLLTWSARDENALKRMLDLYDKHMKTSTENDASFLGDLAFTLATRRSIMPWRSFSVVDSQGGVETLDLSASKSQRAARDTGLAFIFTGQGAQYANMGMELIHYPIFQDTLTAAHDAFKELGAEWSLFEELRNQERINEPEFSQPLCTALQIALVELLATFNIFPDVVIGHSSGEIAAAYAAGALSLRSACKVAYHRGRLAKRAAESSGQLGAMMSVNLAEHEAESYLANSSASGRVSVACINSPTNVTLSGDETAIDQLQVSLEQDGVFPRKLRTGVAYHSPAMHQVAEEYLLSMGNLEPREMQSDNPFMTSSVTGQMVPTVNLLNPQYWVDNMENPVRFTDAVQYVVHTGPKVDGLKTITDYVELGPHGALQRPVRDSLSFAGNSTARYGSALSRQMSPSTTILQLVGQLFVSGHPVSITAANQQDSPSPTAKVVVDGPQYPFDRTHKYWHESRLSRDWRLREGPSKSLLGLRSGDWNPLQPRWRKMLSVEEDPWLADHAVGNSVVLPAAGSTIMAVEAVRQTAGGGSQAIRGYHVKEANFISPIVVAAGQTTEVMTTLRPLQQSYEKSSTRFKIEIFSYAESYWRACANCVIHVEYEREHQTEVDGGTENRLFAESLARKYDDIKNSAKVKFTKSDFYSWLDRKGFGYGPTFRLAEDIFWDGDELAVAEVNVGPPIGLYNDAVVHPGVLDSCFQISPITASKGMTAYIPLSVPQKITDAYIAETGWQNSTTDKIKVTTKAKLKKNSFGLDGQVSVLSESGKVLCYVKRLETATVMEHGPDAKSERSLLHYIDWKPHMQLNNLEKAPSATSSMDEKQTIDDRIALGKALKSIARETVDSVRDIDWANVPAHIQKYMSWLERQLGDGTLNGDVLETNAVNSKLEDLVTRQPSWKMFAEVARSLPGIVRGEAHELELSLSSPLFQDFLDDEVAAVCNRDLEAYVELLVHQKPTQKILEIGAGKGVLASYLLSIFKHIETQTGGIAFSEYVYSAPETALVDEARQRFAEIQDRMDFMHLDASQDLATQGIQPASYDVIFLTGVLRGSKDTDAVLQNVRRALTPGGQLVLHEITRPDRFDVGFGLGVTEEWWGGQEGDEYRDRAMTPSEWDQLLKKNGFSGTNLVIRDSQNDDAHRSSLMISMESTEPTPLPADTRVLIVIEEDAFQKSLAESIHRSSHWNSSVIMFNELITEKIETGSYIICLADVYRSLLQPIGQAVLGAVKNWLRESTNLLWVTAYDANSTTLWSSRAYAGIKDGLLRTLRSEFSLNHIVSLTLEDGTRDVDLCARYISSVFGSAFSEVVSDVEYFAKEGQILTGRLVEDVDTNKDLTMSLTAGTVVEPWLPGPPLTLHIEMPGQLETLQFREDLVYYEDLAPTGVEIEAKVWGVGFRDIFIALGRLDEEDFGADGAGIVTRVGSEVTSVKVGDRVCFQTFDGMKSHPRAHEWTTAKIADSVSFEEACAVIIPGMTALLSLVEVARLQKGEKVLIHSASGGTGQVAVQVAQMIGAEVFATVGFDDKKELLMEQYNVPADHIFYSRDTSFAKGIMRMTDGAGVDVILNSLAGESLRASWECIAPYGRMIEIGKSEINANSSLPMASFAKNAMFAGVDLHHLVKDMKKKDVAHMLLQRTMDLARDGKVRSPSPLHIYEIDSVEDCFRYYASGKNTGRTVIRINQSTVVQKQLKKRRTWKFEENATYIVAGGLGGIGRSILRWMVTRGAKYLLVPSRSGASSSAAAELVQELTNQNIVISTPKCDISSAEALSLMLKESATTLPPIRGCIVASMVLNDCMFENMTLAQWEQTSRSKIEASWNLHTQLPNLDFFIMLASISGVIGNPGQSNYAAGCTFQDALAWQRNQRGQKSISIDLGVMRNVGVVAESQHLQKHLQGSKGFLQIEEAEFLSLLDICCDPSHKPQGQQCQMVMGLDTPARLLAANLEVPDVMQRHLFARFQQLPGQSGNRKGGAEDGTNFAQLFRQSESMAERAQVVVEALSNRLARTLSIKLEDVDAHQALHAYGIDSLIAVELRNWIGKDFAADVPVFEIVSGKSIEAIGELVAKSSQIEKKA